MKPQEVIKRPIISEKSAALTEVANKYVFEVNPAANKFDIRTAVESFFKVKVREVRTMMVPGKVKRAGNGMAKKSNWKKAIVSLADGQKIDFFSESQQG